MNGDLTSKSLGKKAKKGALWSFAREGVTEVLLFPASMVLARLLSPEEFGIAAAANFFTKLAARLSQLGFNAALVRAKRVEPIHLSTVFVVNLVTGLLTFAFLTGIAPAVAAFYGVPETGYLLPIAAIGFLLAPLGTVPAALLSRDLRFRESAMVDWYQGIAFAGSSVVFALLGFSYMSMVYGRLIAVVVQTVTRIWLARWRPSLAFSRQALRDVLSFGAGSHAKSVLQYTTENIDNLIVGKFFGVTTLGLYDKAFSTVERVLARLNQGGPTVMFRIFSVIHEEPDRFRRAYSKVVLSTTMIAFPVFAALIVSGPELIVVLFGQRWLPAAVPFQILCVGGFLKLLNSYASAATQAAGFIWSEVWRQSVYVALIVIGLILLRDWGPAGAALGVLIATAAMTLMMHLLLLRVAHVGWLDIVRPQTPALMCALGTAAAAWAAAYAVRLAMPAAGALLVLFAEAAAAGLFYATFLLFAPHRELRALVHETATDLAPGRIKEWPWVRAYLASHGGPTETSAAV